MVNSLADTPFRFFYREMTGNEVIEDVYTNRADIGFIMYPAHKADKIQELLTFRHLEARPLFQSPTQFFCRVGHPILKELDNTGKAVPVQLRPLSKREHKDPGRGERLQ